MRTWSPTGSQHLKNMLKTHPTNNAKVRRQNVTHVGATAEKWGGPFNTNSAKPTVNISTVNMPTVNMPTVNIVGR